MKEKCRKICEYKIFVVLLHAFSQMRKCREPNHVGNNSPDGGIGRRAGLKHQWSNPCRFDPGSGYTRSAIERRRLFI